MFHSPTDAAPQFLEELEIDLLRLSAKGGIGNGYREKTQTSERFNLSLTRVWHVLYDIF